MKVTYQNPEILDRLSGLDVVTFEGELRKPRSVGHDVTVYEMCIAEHIGEYIKEVELHLTDEVTKKDYMYTCHSKRGVNLVISFVEK